jgi:hypothetical protein
MPRRKLGWPFGALGACLAVQAVGHAACNSRTDPSTNAHWSGGIAMTGGARIKAAMTTVNGTLSLRSIADLPSAYPATNRSGGMQVWLVFRRTVPGFVDVPHGPKRHFTRSVGDITLERLHRIGTERRSGRDLGQSG